MASQNNLRTVSVDGRPVGRRSDKAIGRERPYLTPAEVDRLVTTAKRRGRYGQRDALAILMCYRHGLRVSELVKLRWSQIAWEGTARLTVQRRKGSISGIAQALGKDEVRSLRQIQREQPVGTSYIFQGERGAVTVAWFQRMLKRVGRDCGLSLVHPHQLRHSCGFALADKGRDLREIQMQLGHEAISNTHATSSWRQAGLTGYGTDGRWPGLSSGIPVRDDPIFQRRAAELLSAAIALAKCAFASRFPSCRWRDRQSAGLPAQIRSVLIRFQ